MTVQEAIEILRDTPIDIRSTRDDDIHTLYATAQGMAIEALSIDIVRCKDCKYFEYDQVEKLDGIPLIVAHEICTRWSDGVKTSENGYCFLGERGEADDGYDLV